MFREYDDVKEATILWGRDRRGHGPRGRGQDPRGWGQVHEAAEIWKTKKIEMVH